MFIANGDLPHEDGDEARHWSDDEPHGPRAKAILDAVESEPGHWVCGGECEHHDEPDDCAESECDTRCFSKSVCDCCGSHLAGSRSKASIISAEKII